MVTDIQEIGGEGVTAQVDGHSVAAGNRKLMKRLGIAYHPPGAAAARRGR